MERLEDLVARHFDGLLGPAEEKELASLLGESARAREIAASYMRLEGAVAYLAMAEPAEPGRAERPRPRRFHWASPSRAPWAFWGAAAALFFAVLGLVALRPRPLPRAPARAPAPAAESPAEVARAPEPPLPPPRAPAPPAPAPRVDFPAPPPPAPPPPVPVPAPPLPPAPPRPPESPPAPPTIAATARVERIEGEAFLLEGTAAIRAGASLLPGQGVRVAAGRVTLRFPEGAVLELAAGTSLREIGPGPGKRALLESGTVAAEVPRQPAPFVLSTPHAEARVLGTRFRLSAAADATRLEVREGRVRLTKRDTGLSVDVGAGQHAVAARGVPLAARPMRSAERLLALYTFREGRGTVVRDSSGLGPALDLQIAAPAAVRWLRPRGLEVREPVLIASASPAARISDACRASNELTVEAWIRPADPPPEIESRVVTLSADTTNRNFALGQGELGAAMTAFALRLRTTASDSNGMPPLATPAGAAAPRLTHVVSTRGAGGVTVLYVDGEERARGASGGPLSNWDRAYRLALADEFGGGRPWRGEYHLVAVYGRALAAEEVGLHFRAGAE